MSVSIGAAASGLLSSALHAIIFSSGPKQEEPFDGGRACDDDYPARNQTELMASRAFRHPRIEHGVGRVKWVHIYLYRTSGGELLAKCPCFEEAPYICIRTVQSELSRLVGLS